MAREISHLVRSAIQSQVENGFDLGNVTGLSARPHFTQRLTHRTPEPYVFFQSEQSFRIDETKSEVTREYITLIVVRISYDLNKGGPSVCDFLTDEVIRIIEREPPTINGFNPYIQVIEDVVKSVFEIESKSYFQANIAVNTRVIEDLTAQGNLPVQAPAFGFTGFTNAPTMNRIELFDTGRIVPTINYPNNNGFDFDEAVFALAPGSDGTINLGVVSVDGDDNVSMTSTLSYTSQADSTVTHDLTATTNFPRIRSVRYGVIPTATIDLSTLTSDLRYGTISPVGLEANFVLERGERAYIAFDANEADLIGINQLGFSVDISNQFTMTTQNGFKLYIQDDAWQYADPATLTVRLQ